MKAVSLLVTILFSTQNLFAEEVRLLDLEPNDAQQLIEQQDQNLNYAPKIETSVPAVRFLGNEPHHVKEDIYLARQYHGQDGLGGYLYGYNVPDIAKTEKKKPGGDLRGAYNYIAGDGQEIKVEYWDDGTGFHQIDNVPKILPKQVDDAPDVKAAKDKFFARWHEEAERNTHPVASPYNSEGEYVSGPLAPQNQQPNQYPQQGQYQQPGQYQPQGQYQQPGQYQPQGQYQQPGQYQSQYQQPGQYQPQGQYQQPGQQDYYSGSSSESKSVYQQRPNYQPTGPSQAGSGPGEYNLSHDKEGEYDSKKYENEEDTTGPPKGFFYKFDYPVGIIVSKEGAVKDIYNENKAKFEAQLRSGHADQGSQSSYHYEKN